MTLPPAHASRGLTIVPLRDDARRGINSCRSFPVCVPTGGYVDVARPRHHTQRRATVALFDRKMQDPIPGTARVVDNDGLKSLPGQAVHCPLDLMVEAEGIPAYMVHIKVRPKTGKWPALNQILPVIIDRSDPSRVEVVWDQVQSLQDRIQTGRTRRLEAAQHSVAGGSAAAAPPGYGSPQDLMRQAIADPAAFAEQMRAQAVASAAMPPGERQDGTSASPGDPIDRIAKLADLRDRGALTEQEFQSQKERILGE